MRILLVESEPGIARDYESALGAAGHELVRCHEPAAAAFPCRGVDDHADCPLEAGVIDAALVVRDPIADRPTAREAGVVCALRFRVPVLQPREGGGWPGPYEGYVEEFEGDVVTAVEEAVRRPSVGHATAVRDHLVRAADSMGLASDELGVTAWRNGPHLRVEVTLGPDADPKLRDTAAAWAAMAARRYDPALQTIDVAVRATT